MTDERRWTMITSSRNPRVKNAIKLRDRKARLREGLTLADGTREIGQALAAGVELVELFVCPELLRDEGRQVVDRLPDGARLLQTTAEVFAKVAFGQRAEGLLAVLHPPVRRLADFVPPPDPLIGVLESIEKPGNLGAVVRSADGAGVTAVLAAGPGTDLYNPSAIRASLGAIFHLPVFQVSSREALAWLLEQQITIYAAMVDAAKPYTAVDYRSGSAIVLGSEAVGLSGLWEQPAVTPVALPMLGAADSLNVSAAAAVVFYEALRQRQT